MGWILSSTTTLLGMLCSTLHAVHAEPVSSKAESEATLARLKATGVKAAAIQADLRQEGALVK